ncbi:COX15/CtaA family protein [Radiobacillus sp. PE A8.2]|uniref:COX15/CtaA family protein n=1 Tax=Radiobacillus sp. PE A8.2 TaxID=3380349 RepID=UPI00388FBFCF
MITFLKRLAVTATITMILVLLGGALVTKTDSGMGCGANWPNCEGAFSPALLIELSHRLVSGVAGLVVLLLAILSWKYIGHIREAKFLSFISAFFLILQGLIGAAAVLWAQSDFILALHFGISLISYASVFLLTILIFEVDKKFDADSLIIDKPLRIQIYSLTAYILFVVYTGALVRHMDSSLACTGWPFCDRGASFDLSYNLGQWVHMGHRLVAGIALIWTALLFIRVYKTFKNSRVMIWGWTIAFSLIVIQVLLGAMIIFTYAHLLFALLHALVITIFFGLLCYFILLASRSATKKSL